MNIYIIRIIDVFPEKINCWNLYYSNSKSMLNYTYAVHNQYGHNLKNHTKVIK